MKANNIISSLIVLLSIIVSSISVKSQESNIISNLTITPQSLDHNPSLFLEGKRGYFGFPFLSSINVGVDIPFTLNKIASPDPTGGRGIYINSTNLYNNLRKNNLIAFNANIEFIRFGFKVGNNGFVHFNMSEKTSGLVNLKKNILGLALMGNAEFMGEEYDVGGSSISQMSYTDFSFGYSHKLDKLTVGGRFRVLIGQTNFNTVRTVASISTDPNNYTINAKTDISIRMSTPLSDDSAFRIRDLFSNLGFAFDLGASYKFLDDKLLVEASVIDLGYITWKTNVNEFKSINPNQNFRFEGLDISIAELQSGESSSFDVVLDSLTQSLGVEKVVGNKYSTMLATKIYAGAKYQILKTLDVSGLFRIQCDNKCTNYSFGVSVNYKPCPWFNLSVGNTFNSFSALGLGIGAAISGGPFQFYLMADQISGFTLASIKSANVRFGINFVLKDRKTRDAVKAKKEIQEVDYSS